MQTEQPLWSTKINSISVATTVGGGHRGWLLECRHLVTQCSGLGGTFVLGINWQHKRIVGILDHTQTLQLLRQWRTIHPVREGCPSRKCRLTSVGYQLQWGGLLIFGSRYTLVGTIGLSTQYLHCISHPKMHTRT